MNNLIDESMKLIKIEEIQTNDIEKSNLKKIGNVNSILSQIPNFISAKTLNESYRVIIPAGVEGDLIKYSDNLLGTPIIKDGKIVGHAGLKSLSAMATPMVIYSAMSIVTGQYFLSQINNNISNILGEIKSIRDSFIKRDDSELFSLNMKLNGMSFDRNDTEITRVAKLTEIKNASRDLIGLIYRYNDYFREKLEKTKEDFFKEDFNFYMLIENIDKIRFSLDLYNRLSILEFLLEDSLTNKKIEERRELIYNNNKEMIEIFMKGFLDNFENFKTELKNNANTISKIDKLNLHSYNFIGLKNEIVKMNKDYREDTNIEVKNYFKNLEDINKKDKEYYILNEEIYAKVN